MSRHTWAKPTCSNAVSTAARSSTWFSAAQPSPGSTSTGTFSKFSFACSRVGSTVSSVSGCTPAAPIRASASTTRSLSSRAATSTMSAMAPSGTGHFTPVRRPPLTRALMRAGFGLPLPSAQASVPISSPATSLGSNSSFCAALPAISSASVARYTEDENGTGARERPSSSASTHSPIWPSPAPPYSSGTAAPSHPMAEISCHIARSYGATPSSTRRMRLEVECSVRKRRA